MEGHYTVHSQCYNSKKDLSDTFRAINNFKQIVVYNTRLEHVTFCRPAKLIIYSRWLTYYLLTWWLKKLKLSLNYFLSPKCRILPKCGWNVWAKNTSSLSSSLSRSPDGPLHHSMMTPGNLSCPQSWQRNGTGILLNNVEPDATRTVRRSNPVSYS